MNRKYRDSLFALAAVTFVAAVFAAAVIGFALCDPNTTLWACLMESQS